MDVRFGSLADMTIFEPRCRFSRRRTFIRHVAIGRFLSGPSESSYSLIARPPAAAHAEIVAFSMD